MGTQLIGIPVCPPGYATILVTPSAYVFGGGEEYNQNLGPLRCCPPVPDQCLPLYATENVERGRLFTFPQQRTLCGVEDGESVAQARLLAPISASVR